jgi:tRNA-dihydrouridine synthase B
MSALPLPLIPHLPVTALAPMQDVTDIHFMRVVARYGCPDYFFTEYFRVHESSNLSPKVLRSITENDTGRPVFAQMIGESIPDLVRTARDLARYAIAGIDLNMGCPAPRIYRKNVGGGLLREPETVDRILGELRQSIGGLFTVKMRIGFEDTQHFETILQLINKHKIDLLSLHGRTVKEMYHADVHYDLIAQAVQTVNCPVLANGNITSASSAQIVLDQTQAFGVMIGRSAIRNPWIFQQTREYFAGQPITVVTLSDVRDYVDRLRQTATAQAVPERARVGHLKMYLNYIAQGVDPEGKFLYNMRRTQTEQELLNLCDRDLLEQPDRPFAAEPHQGLFARPKSEAA